MAKIYDNLLELVGNTPLVRMHRIEEALGLKARIVAKLESYNPLRSVKDRAALAMVRRAEAEGKLRAGSVIVEASSGNTGVGLAFVGGLLGYRTIIVMPESMSVERRKLITALGAELELTPAGEGMKGAIRRADELIATIEGAVRLGQFDNPANPQMHEQTTAQEIWRDTEGALDYFVAGVGTGGTISGTAKGLKAHNPEIKAIAVQPSLSPVLTGGVHGAHKLQGMGAGFVPENYYAEYVDEVLSVSNEDAIEMARLLSSREGLLVGYSSGAAMSAACVLAQRPELEGKTIVVLLPDTGERYLSTDLY